MCYSRRIVYPSSHPFPASLLPTTIDGITANTDRDVFGTPHPRPFSSFTRGRNVRPISWQSVPMGMNHVRVWVQADTTWSEIGALVNAFVAWAEGILLDKEVGPEGDRMLNEGKVKWNGPKQVAFVRVRVVKDASMHLHRRYT